MSRTDKRDIIEIRIREVLSLEHELQKIYKAQRNLGHIVLDKPIRDGWYKIFRLRGDIGRSKQAKVYQEVLDAVIVKVWGREKKWAIKSWKKYFKKPRYNIQRPGIRYLEEKEYLKLSSKAQKHFSLSLRKKCYRYKKIYSCTLPRYYFEACFVRAYITKRKIIAPELERREQEIKEILNKSELYKYSQYSHYNYRFYGNPHKGIRRKTNMALNNLDLDQLETLGFKALRGY